MPSPTQERKLKQTVSAFLCKFLRKGGEMGTYDGYLITPGETGSERNVSSGMSV